MFVDNNGDVAISDNIVKTADGKLLEDVGLSSAGFCNFKLVKFVNALHLNEYGGDKLFFLTEESKLID